MKIVRNLMMAALLTTAIQAHADITQVDNANLNELIASGVPVIDVRRQDEWLNTGTIEGSHLMTFFDKNGRYDAKAWLSELDKLVSIDKPFVLICEAGVRSQSIAKLLDTRLGYTGVHNVKKGIRHWINAGETVVPYTP